MKPPTLLLVDDEPPVLAALTRSIHRHFGDALRVTSLSDPQQALRWLSQHEVEIVLSDLRMPGMDGLTLLRHAGSIRPQCVRLMLTASADFDSAQHAINQAGVFRYLCKPWQDEEVCDHLTAAMALATARRAQRDLILQASQPPAANAAQLLEAQRLEALEPGITHVDWGPDGEVLMPPLTDQ